MVCLDAVAAGGRPCWVNPGLVCCVRMPGPAKRRAQEVRTVSRMAEQVCALGAWPAVSWVVGVTSDDWKPVLVLVGRWWSSMPGW